MKKFFISLFYILSINTSYAGIFDYFSSEPEAIVSYGINSGCKVPYILSVTINNKSSNRIDSFSMNAYARYKDYSDKIIFFSNRSTRIIEPGDSYSFCLRANKSQYKNYSSVFMLKETSAYLNKYRKNAVYFDEHQSELDNYEDVFIKDHENILNNMVYELRDFNFNK